MITVFFNDVDSKRLETAYRLKLKKMYSLSLPDY